MAYRPMKRQPRAKAMLPAIKELITIRALENKDNDRNLLAHELIEEIKQKFPHEITPTVETLIKKISEARNHAPDPLNEPWHLGILDKLNDYGLSQFSADAIDAILKVQRWLMATNIRARDEVNKKRKKPEKLGFGIFPYLFGTLSIRQAKWIAALYRTTGKDPQYLWLVSFHYTYREIISNISSTTFNTRNIDITLAHGKKLFLEVLGDELKYAENIFGENYNIALSILSSAGKSRGENK